jgi:hypothetical protein
LCWPPVGKVEKKLMHLKSKTVRKVLERTLQSTISASSWGAFQDKDFGLEQVVSSQGPPK